MLRTMGEYRAAALDSMRKWVCCVNIKACNRILVNNPIPIQEEGDVPAAQTELTL